MNPVHRGAGTLARRPGRYVPRHSTRGPAPRREEDVVVDLTGTPAPAVLTAVLEGLRGAPEGAAQP